MILITTFNLKTDNRRRSDETALIEIIYCPKVFGIEVKILYWMSMVDHRTPYFQNEAMNESSSYSLSKFLFSSNSLNPYRINY